MKANAPEKIWVHELSAKELNVPMKEYHVEYIRADAFIEKAEKYLKDRLLNYIEYYRRGVGVSTEEFIEEFLKTMRQ